MSVPKMASDSDSRKEAPYETPWKAREIPVPGVFAGSRPPRAEDCPTGCAAVDLIMLRSGLPLRKPVTPLEENTALYVSLVIMKRTRLRKGTTRR